MILEIIGICILNEVVKSIGNVGKSICGFADSLADDYGEMDFFEEDFVEDYYDEDYDDDEIYGY